MITWGARGNTNKQQWQSLGAIATGDVHTFTRYRTAIDGASLHPLQRQGLVSADAHAYNIRPGTPARYSLGGSELAPAAHTPMILPPPVPVWSGQLNPNVRI